MSNIDEAALYRAYLEAKADPKKTIIQLANDFGISRGYLYNIIRRIENGNASKIKRCIEDSHLDCFWEYKYRARYSAIPKNQKESSVSMLKKLINDMYSDGFSVSRISSLIGKDRSTIIYHLE